MGAITLITGASAGLGAEFARQYAARGEPLLLVARRRDRLEALAASLPVETHVLTCDLSQQDAAASLIAQVQAEGLEVGRLINNAGFGLIGGFASLPAERQTDMIDLNVRSLTTLCRLVLPKMLAKGRGEIMNVASTAAFQPGPGFAVYFATKAYVLSFTEALHQELKAQGIKVSAFCPRPTQSEFREVAGYSKRQMAKSAAAAPPVVRAAIRGLDRNQAIIVPGALNKGMAQAIRFLPRSLVRRAVAAIKAP